MPVRVFLTYAAPVVMRLPFLKFAFAFGTEGSKLSVSSTFLLAGLPFGLEEVGK